MIIHKGVKVGKLWSNEARHDVVVRASESAYINKELFVEFGELFVKHLRDSGLFDGSPHLLLLDSLLLSSLQYLLSRAHKTKWCTCTGHHRSHKSLAPTTR